MSVSIIKDNRGHSLIETLVASTLTISFLMGGAVFMLDAASDIWKKQSVQTNMLDKRKEIFRLLNNPAAIQATLNHAQNAVGFGCIQNPAVNCNPNASFVPVNLYDELDELKINSLDQLHGYNKDFLDECSTFEDPLNPNDFCRYQLNLSWRPICRAPCESPTAIFHVEYKKSKHSQFQIDPSAFDIFMYAQLDLPAPTPATQLYATKRGHIFVRNDGSTAGIGANSYNSIVFSSLGIGNNNFETTSLLPLVDNNGDPIVNPTFVADYGTSHTCLITPPNDLIQCTGRNDLGDLGNGTFSHSVAYVPSRFDASTLANGFSQIHMAQFGGNLAKTISGTYYFFGSNRYNRFGTLNFTYPGADMDSDIKWPYVQTSPNIETNFPLIANAHEMIIGNSATCAIIDTDRSVTCWGRGDFGLMGDDNSNPSGDLPATGLRISLPSEASSRRVVLNLPGGPVRLVDVVQIIAIDNTMCALLSATHTNRVACWGAGGNGALGNGSTSNMPRANYVIDSFGNPIEGISSVSGAFGNVCAQVTADNTQVYCWGNNDRGQLGLGASSPPVPSATLVPNITTGVSKVVIGEFSTCLLNVDSTILCMGFNMGRRFGAGTKDAVFLSWLTAFI